MNRTRKIRITEINPHVICVLCGGYYINATTITECLHSFCRTCITRYLETSKYCPVCDVMVHKTRPLEYIRSDKTLQDLVYKLVPGLYKIEMKRRREYYSAHDESGVTHPPSEDRGDEFYDRIIYTEDEKISLSLELCAEGIPFKTPPTVHGHAGPCNIKIKDVRYLQCPAAFSVGNIKKFIRMKFDLKQKYEIDVFHTAEPLLDYYTLMDIAYIYTWTRRAPLRLYYTVYENLDRLKTTAIITKMSQTEKVPDINVVAVDTANIKNKKESAENDKEKGTDSEKENLEACVATNKRKYPDGPGDISPDPELEKKHTHTNKRKVNGVPRKRAKKQVVYDSSVLEAMSESEEQLAKLTLSGEDDGSKGVNVNKKMIEAHAKGVAKTNTDTGPMVPKRDSENKESEKTSDTNSDRISHLTVSQFQPLNSFQEIKTTNENVYEFSGDNNEKVEVTKPKAKPGRKKKDTTKSDKSNIPSTPVCTDVSLVKSTKHPGIDNKVKKDTPTKKTEQKRANENGQTPVQKKRGRPALKKPISPEGSGKDVVERVKRKYVRKAVKKDSKNETNAKTKSAEMQGDTNILDVNKKSETGEKGNTQDETLENGNAPSNPAEKLGVIVHVVKETSECNNKKEKDNKPKEVKCASVTKDKDISVFSEKDKEHTAGDAVREPTTPLYGQTPKVVEENRGLPTSPNPECAESNVLINGANSEIGVNDKNASVKTVNSNGDYKTNKCAYDPANFSDKSVGYSVGPKHVNINVPTTSTPLGTAAGLFSVYSEVIGGGSNGYSRGIVPPGMIPYNNTVSPPLSPPGVCVLANYPRINMTDSQGSVTNGYMPMDQNSDQPLDLTNNGHREEYTKGKIFKTKLLKKNYAKMDTVASQKEKAPTTNGIIPGSWV